MLGVGIDANSYTIPRLRRRCRRSNGCPVMGSKPLLVWLKRRVRVSRSCNSQSSLAALVVVANNIKTNHHNMYADDNDDDDFQTPNLIFSQSCQNVVFVVLVALMTDRGGSDSEHPKCSFSKKLHRVVLYRMQTNVGPKP